MNRTLPLYATSQPAEQQPDPTDMQILAITTAYEQGVGKGHDAHHRGEEIQNPYGTPWGCDKAWQMGYEEGKEQAAYGAKGSAVKPEPISRRMRAVHAMILNALDRDAADGKAARGEMAAELRSALSEQQPAQDVAAQEMADVAQDEQYPPCDFCGVIPDHHPWHGSGMFKGVDCPHIHACNGCRHLLPSRTAQPSSDVTQLAEALEELIDLMEDTRRGEYTPDSFTTQPARIALAAHRKGGDV